MEKNTVPLVAVNLALYNLNFKSSYWSGLQTEPFCDLKRLPNAHCWEYTWAEAFGRSWVFTAVSPILAIQTLYSLVVGAKRTIAYSLPGDKYIGSENITLVATVPSADVVIWLGDNVTGFPITFNVGVPNSTVLISTVTGLSVCSGLVAK